VNDTQHYSFGWSIAAALAAWLLLALLVMWVLR
jgi:hypothetical protein